VTAIAQTEREFQAAVIDLAERAGWLVAHFHDSRRQAGGRLIGDRDAAGFPDLVAVRRERLVFAELKSERGKLRPKQADWLRALGQVEVSLGCSVVETYLWRPSQWDDIVEVLL
jgi:hypothetical protein